MSNEINDHETKVTVAKGTAIQFDPTQLETLESSLLFSKIQIELLEIKDNSSLILNQ